MKKYLLTGIVAFVLILSVVQFFQIRSLQENISGSGSGVLGMSSWIADEKMSYEMHGIIPARSQGGTQSQSSNTMVGGY